MSNNIFFVPRTWDELSKAGYEPDPLGLMKARDDLIHEKLINPPVYGDATVRRCFAPLTPQLLTKNVAHKTYRLLNLLRANRNCPPLQLVESVKFFDHKIVPETHLLQNKTGEEGDLLEEIALKCHFSEATVSKALGGTRSYPIEVLKAIIAAAQSFGRFRIEPICRKRDKSLLPDGGMVLRELRDFVGNDRND